MRNVRNCREDMYEKVKITGGAVFQYRHGANFLFYWHERPVLEVFRSIILPGVLMQMVL